MTEETNRLEPVTDPITDPETKPVTEPITEEEALKELIRKSVQPSSVVESRSENIGNLALALSKAQGAMNNGPKSKQGYGYKYMELGVLIDIIRPHLTENELAVIQTHELVKNEKNPTVIVHSTLFHSSNEWHKSSLELPIKIMENLTPAQMIGVNCTYGRRYTLQGLFLIASEEDSDGTKFGDSDK